MGIIIAILVFSLMVLIHEWGHFIVARKNGVFVEEFALGMGPKIVGHTSKKTGTLYSWRLIPMGGFCRMLGEEEASDKEGSFSSKSVWARLAIVAAGPVMNIVMAFVLTVIVMACSGYYTTEIRGLDTGYDAAKAGIEVGDYLLKLAGKRIHTYQDLSYALMDMDGSPVEVVMKKADGTQETLTVTPQYDEEQGRYRLGITIGSDSGGWADVVKKQGAGALPGAILSTLGEAWWQLIGNVKLIIRSFVQLVTGQVSVDNMMGPIGIVSVMDTTYTEAVQYGWLTALLSIFNLTALLSVNLGVMNLFPIPALDGSRIVFLILEGIRRKPISSKVENMIYTIGFILLMALMVFVAYQDIVRLFV